MIGVIGNGGHAKVIADIFKRHQLDNEIVYFAQNTGHYQVSKRIIEDNKQNLRKFINMIKYWHVAIGDPYIRKEKIEWLTKYKANIIRAIHDKAIIADDVTIGEGTSIMAGSIINPAVTIGKGCIINTGSTIDHDCSIADYVNIGPGSHLAGGVNVGTLTNIGTGAVIIPNISIGSQSIIGAGAVVITDIPDQCVAVGVPAKIMKKR